MSIMDSILTRFGLAGLAGLQFGGKRDLYAIFGYKTVLTYTDFYNKYRRQDIAKRIVNAPASATWRNPPKLTGDKAIVDTWNEIAEEHQLWSKIERADRLAGLGNYSILLLGFSDGGNLELPVVSRVGNKLIYVQPYSQLQVAITEIDADIQSERFGLPLIYTVTLGDPLSGIIATGIGNNIASTINKQIKVHYSRVVHIAEELCESNFLGTPRLEACYNLLDDLLKVAGGSSETYWLAGNKGMQVDIDKDADLSADDAAALSDEIEQYQHELRRFVRTKGVKMNNLGGTVPNPQPTFDVLLALISGATGIPRRILTGSEAGQLASDQDRANWSDRIKERRITFAEPNVLNPLLVALMNAGVLPVTGINKFGYEWPLNFQLTPLEEAQTMAQRARATINLAKHFLDGHPLMSVEEARKIINLPPVPEIGVIPPPTPVAPPKGSLPIKGGAKNDIVHQPNDYSAKS